MIFFTIVTQPLKTIKNRCIPIGQHKWEQEQRIVFWHWIDFFTRNWFKKMLIKILGWPYYILTKCGSYHATYQFLHFAVTTVVCVKNTLQMIEKFWLPATISCSFFQVNQRNCFEMNSKTFWPKSTKKYWWCKPKTTSTKSMNSWNKQLE